MTTWRDLSIRGLVHSDDCPGLQAGRQYATDYNDGNSQPAQGADLILPDNHTQHAGKNDAGVRQIGRQQRIAQPVGPGHGQLRRAGKQTDQRQQDRSPDVVSMPFMVNQNGNGPGHGAGH